MLTSRYYLMTFLLASLASAAVICTVNYIIDPFSLFDPPRLNGLNAEKPSLKNRRLFMPLYILRDKPSTITLGSSRGTQIYQALRASEPHQRPGDATLSALRAREAVEFLKFFSTRTDVKKVVYVADFFSFNDNFRFAPGFIPGIVAEGRLWRLQTIALFGLSTLKASMETISINFRGANATASQPADEGLPTQSNNLRFNFRSQLQNYLTLRSFYKDYKPDIEVRRLLSGALRQVIAAEKEVVIIIGPSHALQWEAIHASGNWTNFENWKRAMTAISEETGVPVWDFASFSPISTLDVDASARWYEDSSHFSAATSELVLACIRRSMNCDLIDGVRLRQNIIEDRLASIRTSRVDWLRKVRTEDIKLLAGDSDSGPSRN
jgi:hypothetical protein